MTFACIGDIARSTDYLVSFTTFSAIVSHKATFATIANMRT